MNRIRLLIKEIFSEVFLNEAEPSLHFSARYKGRIKKFESVISEDDYNKIQKGINKIKYVDFPKNISFGILVASLDINNNAGHYYKIDGSVGDEIWMIMRENEIITIILRKSSQTIDNKTNKDDLDVGFLIKNIDKTLANSEIDIKAIKNLIAKNQFCDG